MDRPLEESPTLPDEDLRKNDQNPVSTDGSNDVGYDEAGIETDEGEKDDGHEKVADQRGRHDASFGGETGCFASKQIKSAAGSTSQIDKSDKETGPADENVPTSLRPKSPQKRSPMRVATAPYERPEEGKRVVSISLKPSDSLRQTSPEVYSRPLPVPPLRDPFYEPGIPKSQETSSKNRPPTSRDRISRFLADAAPESKKRMGPESNTGTSRGQSRHRRSQSVDSVRLIAPEMSREHQSYSVRGVGLVAPQMSIEETEQLDKFLEQEAIERSTEQLLAMIRRNAEQARTREDPEVHDGPGYIFEGQFFEGSAYEMALDRLDKEAEQREKTERQRKYKTQKARDFERRWVCGLDPRDDVRFDIIKAPVSGQEVRISKKTYSGERLCPRRGSNPPRFEILGEHARASDLVKALTRHPQEKARTQSSPGPSLGPPPWALAGASDMTASWYYNRNSANMPAGAPGPRQIPNPAGQSQPPQMQQQQQQQVNGVGGGQPVMIPNSLPHAGNQTDMNYLWSVVQELSDVLAHNRSQTSTIINNVQQIQARARAEEPAASTQQVNGENNGSASNNALEIADLQGRLHTITRQRDELIVENEDLVRMVNDFENTLEGLMGKVREYAHEHTIAVVATHRHYNTLLEQERDANLTLRIEHGQWQAGLGRAAELARQALRERSKDVEPMERKVSELKAENRVLRRLLGWTVEEDSEAEEEKKQEEEARRAKDEERYRLRQGAAEEASQPPA